MKNLLFVLFLWGYTMVSAQEVPLNPAVLSGKLDNGLTYYIQKNTLPKDRAMFYLVVNAGAIDEDENQNGLAHFCEHMATDKEAQNITFTQYIKHPGTEKKDLGYVKSRMMYSLYNSMLSDRYNELLQKENPPMISASSGYTSFNKNQEAYYVRINALNNDPIKSLKATMIENERVKRHGFTESELDRAKKRSLVSYEKAFKEKDKQMSSSYVFRYMSHFTDDYPSPDADYSYELAQAFLPTITLDQVNELAKIWMTDENRIIVVHGPEKEGVKIPTDTEIRYALAEVKQSKIDPYQDKMVDTKLISEELKGSPVVKEEKIKDFDGTKFTLANGVAVYFKPTDNKDDEIQLQAFSNGGLSLYPAEDLPSAGFAASAKNISGVSKYSSQDLRKVLTGKMVSVSPVLTDLEEMIICNSTVADFETMLQLIYLQFTAPRRDDVALKAMIDRNKAFLQNRKSDPNSAFSDTLQMLMSNYSKRVNLMNPEYFDKINFDRAYAVADERFKDASDFKFLLIGNVDPVKMKPLIEKYLGSIPDIKRKEFWMDNKVGPKKGRTEKEIIVPMKDPKAQVYVHYFGELTNTPENEEYLKAIQYILRMRYTETIREKEGGTYGVGVSATMVSRPTNNYKITMSFTCDPKKADFLKGLLYDEIKKLKEFGVTGQEVVKTRENFMKEASEKLKDNGYILDRVKNYINNGIYTPLPKYTTEIYEKLDGRKIQKLAQKVFAEDQVELVMKPDEAAALK